MDTWKQMSLDCQRAAQRLLAEGRIRSSISRSYYAAYSAIAGELEARGMTYGDERNNPSHGDLSTYLLRNIGTLPQFLRYDLKKAILRLWSVRVDADYIPKASLDLATARDALRDSATILRELGVSND